MRSPTRTTSEVTVMLARNVGVAMPSSAACAGRASASRMEIEARVVRIIVIASVIASVLASAEQRRGRLHHLVGGADDLGIHLVGTLRGDQVAHLRDDVDIGLFEAALGDLAVAFGVRGAVLRRAGGRSFGEQIAADRLKA